MARPPTTLRQTLRDLADLYSVRLASLTHSLRRLAGLIILVQQARHQYNHPQGTPGSAKSPDPTQSTPNVQELAEAGLLDFTEPTLRSSLAAISPGELERVKKLLERACRDVAPDEQGVRKLWIAITQRADPVRKQHPDYLSMDRKRLDDLNAALAASHPQLAGVAGHLAAATDDYSADASPRLSECAQAVQALEVLIDKVQDDIAAGRVLPGTPAADGVRELLRHTSAYCARAFDAAIGHPIRLTGAEQRDSLRLARSAAHAGYHAGTAADSLRGPGLVFGRRVGSAPRSVALHSTNRWIGSLAVLSALEGGTPEQVLTRTRSFLRELIASSANLRMPSNANGGQDAGETIEKLVNSVGNSIDDATLLTQTGHTLLHTGRRKTAADHVAAAWQHWAHPSAIHRERRRWNSPPDELLELTIELAGIQYAHGETDAAAATLTEELRDLLDSDPGGDPEGAGWGEVCSFIYYRQLRAAMTDPAAAVDALRTEWLQALGPATSTAYPSKWILAATLAQLLTLTGDQASAATVAVGSVTRLEAPVSTAEQQLRAHLSEMYDSDPVPARDNSRLRAKQLLAELIMLAVREPDALDYACQSTLTGLTELIAPRRRRLRWPRRAA